MKNKTPPKPSTAGLKRGTHEYNAANNAYQKWMRKYDSAFRERERKCRQKPKWKAYISAYRKRPERKEYMKKYRQSPKYKEYHEKYGQSPKRK